MQETWSILTNLKRIWSFVLAEMKEQRVSDSVVAIANHEKSSSKDKSVEIVNL